MNESTLQEVLDAARVADGLRAHQKLASRSGLLESYAAYWHFHGGCLDPGGRLQVRVNRFRVRATIKGEAFDTWQDAPSEIERRVLNATEWQRMIAWVDASGFWQLPSSHAACAGGFHAEAWTIEGFRDGQFHFVRRTTWSVLEGVGAGVFQLGKCMADLARLKHFQDTENEAAAEQQRCT